MGADRRLLVRRDDGIGRASSRGADVEGNGVEIVRIGTIQ